MIVNFETAIGDHDPGGIWTEQTNSGVDISDPTSVDFTGVAQGIYIFTYVLQGQGSCSGSFYSTVTVYVNDGVATIEAYTADCTWNPIVINQTTGLTGNGEHIINNDTVYKHSTLLNFDIKLDSEDAFCGDYTHSFQKGGYSLWTRYNSPQRAWGDGSYVKSIDIYFWDGSVETKLTLDLNPATVDVNYLSGPGGNVNASDLALTNSATGSGDWGVAIRNAIKNAIVYHYPTVNIPNNTDVRYEAVCTDCGLPTSQMQRLSILFRAKNDSDPYSVGINRQDGDMIIHDNGTDYSMFSSTLSPLFFHLPNDEQGTDTELLLLPSNGSCPEVSCYYIPDFNGNTYSYDIFDLYQCDYHTIVLQEDPLYSPIALTDIQNTNCVFATSNISVVTDCSDPILYTWELDGVEIASGSNLNMIDSDTYGPGNYQCIITCQNSPEETCEISSNIITIS